MPKTLNNKVHDQLDNLNRRILKELCENARISTTEIGRRVGLSSPAVAERVQKMQDYGLITGYSTHVDYSKIGLSIRAFIRFKAKIKHAEMIRLVDAMPQVVEWHSVTGDVCMIIKVAVHSSNELESIIAALSEYGETETSLILSGSKNSEILKQIPSCG